MRKLTFALLVFAAAVSSYAQMPKLTSAEKAEGWKLMFDGKTLNGWRGYKTQTASDKWHAIKGELVRDGEGEGGDLMTVEQYGDFDMRFEWKISEKGNSGVIYRIAETEPYPWHTGPEYQVLHNQGHSDGKSPLTQAGSNFAVVEVSKDMTRPVGEWNEGRIVAKGNHVEHWLNGVKVVEYEVGSPDWEKRVQASKFGKIPPYGRTKSGYIALQDHGNRVSFRNLKIKRL